MILLVGRSWRSSSCGDRNGVGPDSLCGPDGVTVDANLNVYVADSSNMRVLEYQRPVPLKAAGVSPASIAFGTVAVGSMSSSVPVTVTNNDPISTLNIGSLITNSTAFLTNFGTCANPVPPAQPGNSNTCQFSVTFKPASATNYSVTLLVKDNAINTPQKVKLTGTGQ